MCRTPRQHRLANQRPSAVPPANCRQNRGSNKRCGRQFGQCALQKCAAKFCPYGLRCRRVFRRLNLGRCHCFPKFPPRASFVRCGQSDRLNGSLPPHRHDRTAYARHHALRQSPPSNPRLTATPAQSCAKFAPLPSCGSCVCDNDRRLRCKLAFYASNGENIWRGVCGRDRVEILCASRTHAWECRVSLRAISPHVRRVFHIPILRCVP